VSIYHRQMGWLMVTNKVVFITGCGSLAKAIVRDVLKLRPKKVILFSRDEGLQEIARSEISDIHGVVRYFIGDVRDVNRLHMALRGVDYVVHTAALKRIDTVEYNPLEAVQTNVLGTANVITACVNTSVRKATFVSTDKAVQPINFYGMTKGVGEKLWIDSNYYKPIFNVVRYGNVMGSRGSVLPLFERCAKNDLPLPVTDERMTRFWVRMDEAVKLVLMAMDAKEGYTYVLKCPTFKVMDLAMAIGDKFEIAGMRPGEKLHETLIGEHETGRVVDRKWFYAIMPEIHYTEEKLPRADKVEPVVSSEGNVTKEEIREWLQQ